jgi:menaquinone-dependent protoporphyrinogen oxidase
MKVLVAAASQHGSTTSIARVVAEVLKSRGLEVSVADVADPGDVGALAAYDAVVLGSAVYTGRWMSPAVKLAERVATELPGRPVWLFSSGPVGNPSRKLVRQMDADPVDVRELILITQAREHRRLAGKLDRHELHGLQRASLLLFRGLEGDFRDWATIRSWAGSIADQLLAPAAA